MAFLTMEVLCQLSCLPALTSDWGERVRRSPRLGGVSFIGAGVAEARLLQGLGVPSATSVATEASFSTLSRSCRRSSLALRCSSRVSAIGSRSAAAASAESRLSRFSSLRNSDLVAFGFAMGGVREQLGRRRRWRLSGGMKVRGHGTWGAGWAGLPPSTSSPLGRTILRMTVSPPAPAPVSAAGRPNPWVSIVFKPGRCQHLQPSSQRK
jgi:hypothetical protein